MKITSTTSRDQHQSPYSYKRNSPQASPSRSSLVNATAKYKLTLYISLQDKFPDENNFEYKVESAGHEIAFLIDSLEAQYLSNVCHCNLVITSESRDHHETVTVSNKILVEKKYLTLSTQMIYPSHNNSYHNSSSNAVVHYQGHNKNMLLNQYRFELFSYLFNNNHSSDISVSIPIPSIDPHAVIQKALSGANFMSQKHQMRHSGMFQGIAQMSNSNPLFPTLDNLFDESPSPQVHQSLLHPSSNSNQGQTRIDSQNLAYGEVDFFSFVNALHDDQMISATDGMVFYDLGSGIGKATIAAALSGIAFLRCTAIEILPELEEYQRKLFTYLQELSASTKQYYNNHNHYDIAHYQQHSTRRSQRSPSNDYDYNSFNYNSRHDYTADLEYTQEDISNLPNKLPSEMFASHYMYNNLENNGNDASLLMENQQEHFNNKPMEVIHHFQKTKITLPILDSR